MELLGKLGIDVKLLIAQVVNFALLLLILQKFLYRPIIDRIEKDEAELLKASDVKKELESEKNRAVRQNRQDISDAKKKAKKILSDAEKVAEEIRATTRRDVQEEKRRLLDQFHARLNEMKIDEDNKKK